VFLKLKGNEIVSGFSRTKQYFFYSDDNFRSVDLHQIIVTKSEYGTCSANNNNNFRHMFNCKELSKL